MKKTYIVAIRMVVAAIVILMTAADDMSTYSTFQQARDSGQKVKIAGQLSKDKPMEYNPEIDPNYFSFYIKDTDGEEQKVVLLSEKPQDFELSEQIVLTGKMKGEGFVATEMLMKCPSKYKDEEIFIKAEEGISES
ncbi:MAG: cytochrome c maturation protein CcmE [Bacteroidota bacterium]